MANEAINDPTKIPPLKWKLMISPAVSLSAFPTKFGPKTIANVELYPFVNANKAIFTILNQSDLKIPCGDALSWISTSVGMKIRRNIVRMNNVFGVKS